MATKTLTITTEAYERLVAHKREKESFTDVINRLAKRNTILDLAGTLTEEEAKDINAGIALLRKKMDEDFNRRIR